MTNRPIPDARKARVHEAAANRCGYCLTPQAYAMHVLEIDHIIPRAAGGSDDEGNLWLACRLCNNAKGAKTHGYDSVSRRRVRLFNPRIQKWRGHFYWSEDGVRVMGRTACGRATVIALATFQMRQPRGPISRRRVVLLRAAPQGGSCDLGLD